ncbi:ABC transporter ATP-binding protein [Aliikangiella sp. IMCC44632]
MQTVNQSNVLINATNISWQVRKRLILDNISFQVKQNEFVGIIGPNGAGKSSLLRCLYQKIIPTQGNIDFAGKALKSYSRKALAQQLAVVLQEAPMRFELSVMDVIRMGLTPNKSLLSFDTHADSLAIINAAKQVDLADKLEQSMNSLSGGEKQRAMIARAILQCPRLLIMDEPTNHLDVRHQKEVLTLAKKLNITVIVSIHDLNLAAAYCDKLILLDQGKIVAQGTPEEVINQPTLKQVFAVDSLVDSHPFNNKLRITFDMGESHVNK